MKQSDPLKVTQQHLARAQRWPIGQAVTVTKEDGSTFDTVTTTPPWRSTRHGHPWVMVVLADPPHAYPLARIVERP